MPSPPTFSFCAPSNSGKTTFLCALITRLKKTGIRVGACKSCHHPIKSNSVNSDSSRLKEAGADKSIAIVGAKNWPKTKLALMDMDIVLIEGGRQFGEPAILLAGWKNDPDWQPPRIVHADISERQNPLEAAFQIAQNAVLHTHPPL